MMQYPLDRKSLKAASKEWIRTAVPSALLVTLLYLLATSGISYLIDAFSPVQDLLEQAQEAVLREDLAGVQVVFQQYLSAGNLGVLMFVGILFNLYSLVVGYGYMSYALGVTRGLAPGYGEPFSRFYMAGRIILTELLCGLFVFLWSMLFLIPGIIAAYRYQMAPYILLDDPDCTPLEAIRRSKELMRGRKWELFVLELSFFGWFFLASALSNVFALLFFPLGVVVSFACNLLLLPYQSFTLAQWYDGIRLPEEQPGTNSEDWQPPYEM